MIIVKQTLAFVRRKVIFCGQAVRRQRRQLLYFVKTLNDFWR
ncbi:hypothetical protein HMPREF9123_1591 [Neisseria bacilliformis ATCC BAA-1200]|uniref:Uncharacterized protein n=1 Tax=Neisseria bacilliformis ATCC BAA-1200 TaxID=888742 RepID=F2BCW1_9NEIS|nr:hypothetical protein HMPREF9123_1591 [Neisseria bacilliformis ATCC BAA-1200]